ncbi:MAG: hypothetical protein E7J02_12970 [Staphylococcus warneri]|nr:hypothetical protein [Veillonella sp.]MDU1612190.1 hypothetical protein [Staphylococcus epidermidis]MDU1788508.1 hypothetical protein [Streptococcus thermophilus]MDU4503891.1 hypothetical protein [Staphylococcus warneri]MDU6089982.1 hypothetical protein [Staphylococcus lugdunensis]
MDKRKVGETNYKGEVWICTPYITKNGKKIFPKTSKFFCFWAKPKK